MQHWQYLSVSLFRDEEKKAGWQVRQVDGIEQNEWWKGRSYSTWEDYIGERSVEGWKLFAVDHGDFQASLTFKRPLS